MGERNTPHFSAIGPLKSLVKDPFLSWWSTADIFCGNFSSHLWKQTPVTSASVWFFPSLQAQVFEIAPIQIKIFHAFLLKLVWHLFFFIIDRHGYCPGWVNSSGKWYWCNSDRSVCSLFARISAVQQRGEKSRAASSVSTLATWNFKRSHFPTYTVHGESYLSLKK